MDSVTFKMGFEAPTGADPGKLVQAVRRGFGETDGIMVSTTATSILGAVGIMHYLHVEVPMVEAHMQMGHTASFVLEGWLAGVGGRRVT